MSKVAALRIETFDDTPGEIHVFPQETRRGRAQWAMWIKPDGSGTLFSGNEQIQLPKNGPSKYDRRMGKV